MLFDTPYAGYAYSYPHKTAYRLLREPVGLPQAIAGRRRNEAHLYMHIPFCQSRCGYCNLFTTVGVKPGDYLRALRNHARDWHEAGAAEAFRFQSFAIGGGTPLLLDPLQLQALFDTARTFFGVDAGSVPVSVETAPRQTTPEKVAVLRQNRVRRVSIGIQSFIARELKTLGRNHRLDAAIQALELLGSAGFPCLNIDLIYGIPLQTPHSFVRSLERALSFAPHELFLYPLYIRPHTALDQTGTGTRQHHEHTLRLYRAGRDYLLAQGFVQTSMRRFIRCADHDAAPEFSCSEENMISVGCGGRSYIGNLHFSEPYAVEQYGCRQILQAYTWRRQYTEARYGIILSETELKRRFVMKNLLYYKGLSSQLYAAAYGTLPEADFPLLQTLQAEGLCTHTEGCWRLTPEGMAYSDAIGPAFISEEVKRRMARWKEF